MFPDEGIEWGLITAQLDLKLPRGPKRVHMLLDMGNTSSRQVEFKVSHDTQTVTEEVAHEGSGVWFGDSDLHNEDRPVVPRRETNNTTS